MHFYMVLRPMNGNYLIYEGPDQVVEYYKRKARLRISQIKIARNVEAEITNFVYEKIRQASHNFSKYKFKYIRFANVQTSTSFIQFEKAADHLEFIKLLDQQEFNSVKLKVQPFGFTNSDYQECGKPMMWQTNYSF